jgi:hypothetical protein
MKITLIPPKIDAFCEAESIEVFSMEMVDEFTASIEIKSWIDRESWPHIQKAVADALEMMFPEGN